MEIISEKGQQVNKIGAVLCEFCSIDNLAYTVEVMDEVEYERKNNITDTERKQ